MSRVKLLIQRGFLRFFRSIYSNGIDSLRDFEPALANVADYFFDARFFSIEGDSDARVYAVHRVVGNTIVLFQDRPYPVLARSGPASGNLESNRLKGRL